MCMISELTVPATVGELEKVQAFVEEQLEVKQCSPKSIIQMAIAVEEIYVNIAKYAYFPQVGNATIRSVVGGNPLSVMIQFLDNGSPFNPLDKETPDTTLSVEERDIGGLGILMVRKSMDEVDYSYEDGNNILTIKKQLV